MDSKQVTASSDPSSGSSPIDSSPRYFDDDSVSKTSGLGTVVVTTEDNSGVQVFNGVQDDDDVNKDPRNSDGVEELGSNCASENGTVKALVETDGDKVMEGSKLVEATSSEIEGGVVSDEKKVEGEGKSGGLSGEGVKVSGDSYVDKVTVSSTPNEGVDFKTDGGSVREVEADKSEFRSEGATQNKEIEALNGGNEVPKSADKEVSDVVDEDAAPSGDSNAFKADAVESNESKLVEENGVKFTPEGGSVREKEADEGEFRREEATQEKKVEALNGENDVPKSADKEVTDAVDENAVPTCDSNALKTEAVESNESKMVEENGVKFTSEGDLMREESGEIEFRCEQATQQMKIEALNGRNDVLKSADKEVTDVVDEESGDSNALKTETVESNESKLIEENGVKFTSEGDFVVEARQVDLSGPGTATVGGADDNEDSAIKEIEAPVDGSVKSVDLSSHVVDADSSSSVRAVGADSTGNNVQPAEIKPRDVETSVADVGEDRACVSAENVTQNMKANEEVYYFAEGGGALSLQESVADDKQSDYMVKNAADGVEFGPDEDIVADGDDIKSVSLAAQPSLAETADEAKRMDDDHVHVSSHDDAYVPDSTGPGKFVDKEVIQGDGVDNQTDEEGDIQGSVSDGDNDGVIFGSSEAAKQFIEELERGSGRGPHSAAESSGVHSQRIDGQIVTDSDEEDVDTDEEGGGKELFDSNALAALLKAATGADSDGGSITITSQDGSRLFSVERPAGLGSSIRSLKPTHRPNRSDLFAPSSHMTAGEADGNLSKEEKTKLENLQQIRVKFLRLVQRLGVSSDESVVAQVLYRLALVAGRQTGQLFSIDAAKSTSMQLEAEGKEDLDFSVNILVLGKSGVGKSATINSIFGEEKAVIDAFEPATTHVKEIRGVLDGVKIRVFDTPGLKSSVMEQAFNRIVLSSIKRYTKRCPPDIVLYVDRLDAQTRDLNDLPLLRTITSSLGSSIWRSAIVTLTHAASAPPDGQSGSPLSYEMFVTQRSHVVQQCIGQAVGDLRMMSPNLMNPVSLVENHPLCRKNREGQKVLPNGQSWRPQLLLLCYSMKILSEASSLSKPQDPFDHRKLFGFRTRSPPLPYMLSSMLQSRVHPKLSSEQGGENGDSDIELADLSDSDEEDEEDEYDQLPPFKPLRKSQIAKLSKEQRKAYFEEYDYRVKLLQKKQWKEEVRRIREMKKKGKDTASEIGYMEEDADSGAAAPVAVPLPDMVLPPSFDSDNPAFRYRFLEPSSQFLARPVLDTHGWDHDCGYDGVNLEQSLAIANRFPAAVVLQITKDKKDMSISLDSSVAAKHGENGSSMAGFDIQNIGKQLAYIVRGETKFRNLKKNKTAAGISVTFLGENVVTGLKIEDQIVFGKQYVLVGSAGTVRFQGDAAYGANFELQRRELDYPIGQVQSTLGLSLIKWRGDFALGFNSLAQFSVGRNSKVAVRAGINNKLSGQITVKTSSSDHLSLALVAVIPTAISIYRKLFPVVSEKYSIY